MITAALSRSRSKAGDLDRLVEGVGEDCHAGGALPNLFISSFSHPPIPKGLTRFLNSALLQQPNIHQHKNSNHNLSAAAGIQYKQLEGTRKNSAGPARV